jgi:hypothetical protein
MLQIIGAGLGRTGTMSLKTALERLGFGPCHHMLGLFDDPGQIPLWQRAARGESMDWTKVYAGYRATVDWPGARFWREIAAGFPAAKVILTLRDPASWYASAKSSIYAAATAPLPASGADPVFASLREMSHQVVWDGFFDGRFQDEAHAVKVFEKHNKAVIKELDNDRLLTFNVRQGWEPLCDFLGVPVPDEPFPRTNDRDQFAAEIQERLAGANVTHDR